MAENTHALGSNSPRKRGLLGVIAYLRPYPIPICITVGLLLINIAIEMTLPRLIGDVINRLKTAVETSGNAALWPVTALFLGLITLRAINGLCLGPVRNRLVQRVLVDIRSELFDAMQRLPFAYHDKTNTGELISRANTDAWRLQDFFFACLFLSVDIAVTLTATVVLLFSVHSWMGWLGLGTLIPTVSLVIWFAMRLQPHWREVHDQHGKMTSVIQENIAGVRVVKAFARESSEVEKFLKRRDAFLKTLLHAVNSWAARVPMAQFLHGLSIPLALWLGGTLVLRGDLTVGALTSAVLYLMAIGHRMGAVGQFTNIVQNAKAASERILEVIDEPRAIQSGSAALDTGDGTDHSALSVEFRGVHFAYGGGRDVLSGITLRIEPGEVIGVLGATGAGKSTLLSLIPRFRDATQGTVLIGGREICSLRLDELRRAIGVAFQESYLFSASVAENIAYGNPKASRAEIEAAAMAADAHEFVTGLPKGYDTVVGERGVTLSGGQRQRIGLARAFLMNPRILLLDDATSSLDARTERRIQEAMRRLAVGRTTFIIAHRLSSVRHADRILVLDAGRIVATGRHETLLQENTYYAGLAYQEEGINSPAPAAKESSSRR